VSADFDVAIVGGGPAGTSTALHLAIRDRIAPARVVMLERATFPRDKPCAGAVSTWGLEALARLGVPLDVPHAPIDGLRVLA
jgi:flavin-dependent dehydrogenase